MRLFSYFPELRYIIPPIPLVHWWGMGIGALILAGIIQFRKRTSLCGYIALWLSVFFVMFLLDSLVLIRYLGIRTTWHSDEISIGTELERLLYGGKERWMEMTLNFLSFLPFGFFLSVYLSSMRRFRSWQRIGFVTLFAFCLSLCIECLQLALHIGYFELTDLLLNAIGAFVGAVLAVVGNGILMNREGRKRSTGIEYSEN